jgi:hypothetical protein
VYLVASFQALSISPSVWSSTHFTWRSNLKSNYLKWVLSSEIYFYVVIWKSSDVSEEQGSGPKNMQSLSSISTLVSCLACSSTLKLEVIFFFEMSIEFQQTTKRLGGKKKKKKSSRSCLSHASSRTLLQAKHKHRTNKMEYYRVATARNSRGGKFRACKSI